MKNIFAKYGVKKVAGVAMATVTLMVGIGLVSNFSGGNPSGVSERGLNQYSDKTSWQGMNGSDVSRAELETQMQERAAARGNRSIEAFRQAMSAEERLAYNRAHGIDGDNVDGSSIGGASIGGTSADSSYIEGFGDGSGEGALRGPAGSGVVGDLPDATATENALEQSMPSAEEGGATGTQLNKLQSSRGTKADKLGTSGASSLKGSSSSSYNLPRADSSTRALPKANLPQQAQANAETFKSGRAGSMGGFNTRASGVGSGSGSGAYYSNTAGELLASQHFSTKGVGTRQKEGAKTAADAAFDGSDGDTVGNTIEAGATIEEVNRALGASSGDITQPKGSRNTIGDSLSEVSTEMSEYQNLQKKLNNKLLAIAGIAFVAAIAIVILKNIPIWGQIAAIAVSAAAVLGILAFWFAGENSINNIMKKMGEFTAIEVDTSKLWWKIGLVNAGAAGLLAAGWLLGPSAIEYLKANILGSIGLGLGAATAGAAAISSNIDAEAGSSSQNSGGTSSSSRSNSSPSRSGSGSSNSGNSANSNSGEGDSRGTRRHEDVENIDIHS